MLDLVRRLFVLAVLAGFLAAPTVSVACSNSGETVEERAEQAISWASALVEWHSRRRVATAAAGDYVVIDLHDQAESELSQARSQYDSGMYAEALGHAEAVSTLLDN